MENLALALLGARADGQVLAQWLAAFRIPSQ